MSKSLQPPTIGRLALTSFNGFCTADAAKSEGCGGLCLSSARRGASWRDACGRRAQATTQRFCSSGYRTTFDEWKSRQDATQTPSLAPEALPEYENASAGFTVSGDEQSEATGAHGRPDAVVNLRNNTGSFEEQDPAARGVGPEDENASAGFQRG